MALRAGLDVYVWRGLRLGASGFLERLMLTFAGDPTARVHATSAIDQYYGGIVSAGYDY